ncbi:MAG: hypothetical protein Rubg2KO_15510 [Rubricoccaceae bacterium]
MSSSLTFSNLVLARCGELGDGAPADFDAVQVAEEGSFAATEVASRLTAEQLLAYAPGIVRQADVAVLPFRRVDASDDTATPPIRGRDVVALPGDFGELVRLEVNTYHVPVTRFQVSGTTIGVGANGSLGLPRLHGGPSLHQPEVLLEAFAWTTDELTAVGAESRSGSGDTTVLLSMALYPQPVLNLTPTKASDVIRSLVYLPDNVDVKALTGRVRDAVAWFTVARLQDVDPETTGLAQRAQARGESVLARLPLVGAGVTVRRGLAM